MNTLDALVDDSLGVDLHQEMHAAAQIESQIHREGAQALQPFRRVRQQIERDHISRVSRIGVEFFFQQSFGFELLSGIGKAHAHRTMRAGIIKQHASGLDIVFFQRLFHQRHHGAIDLHGGLGAIDLQCRRLAVKIRQRVERAEQQGYDDKNVFPVMVAIHMNSVLGFSINDATE